MSGSHNTAPVRGNTNPDINERQYPWRSSPCAMASTCPQARLRRLPDRQGRHPRVLRRRRHRNRLPPHRHRTVLLQRNPRWATASRPAASTERSCSSPPKVWLEHYGYEQTLKSVEISLRKLKTDYIDLLLLRTSRSPTCTAHGTRSEALQGRRGARRRRE